MKLSILDQSPIRVGGTARQALRETLTLAKQAERWGYQRFWVSEHHNSTSLAGSAPEVLLAAIGAATERIRIGSGGVMLPHYSAYKVAETFSVLSNLYPGRIDLGVGRAPGPDLQTAQVLATDGKPKFERFPQLVDELRHMLRDDSFRPRVTPAPVDRLPIWILGKSRESAILAGQNGLPYSLALFLNSQLGPDIMELYRREFRPSEQLDSPRTILTINVVCAETEEEACTLASSRNLLCLRYARGEDDVRVPTVEEAGQYPYSAEEQAFLKTTFQRAIVGNPAQVRTGIEHLAAEFEADEIMVVTITHDFAARLRSYELIMQVFGERKN